MGTKVEVTYEDGSRELRCFESTEAAVEFLKACDERYWMERIDRYEGLKVGALIESFRLIR